MESNKKFNEINCTCGKKQEMKEQDVKNSGLIKLKYACSCGRTGMVLLSPNETFDLYIYNEEGNMEKYDSGLKNDE